MIINSRCLVRLATLFCLVTVASSLVAAPFAYAVELESVTVWNWGSNTACVASSAEDVDSDGDAEIVTGGYYSDGTRDNAQLCVWDGSTLVLENVTTWYWTSNTLIGSVAVGDVDGDQSIEIVTGGYYSDGTRNNAQLAVWSGSTLALEQVKAWYWVSDTFISSVTVGDVDSDGDAEVITGGFYNDGTRYNAQLCVWDGKTLALEDVTTWYWVSHTTIFSAAVGDVDSDGDAEIVTGGWYYDGIRSSAQICVWDGSTLDLEDVTAWYWGVSTDVYSVAIGDVDGEGSVEIVTGGDYSDGMHPNAQLCVWEGATLTLEDVTTWNWTEGAEIGEVGVGDVDSDGDVEIVTGGEYYDGVRWNAQLCVWDGATLALEDVTTWYWVSETYIYSATIGDVNADDVAEIVTGGTYSDAGTIAQLVVWSIA